MSPFFGAFFVAEIHFQKFELKFGAIYQLQEISISKAYLAAFSPPNELFWSVFFKSGHNEELSARGEEAAALEKKNSIRLKKLAQKLVPKSYQKCLFCEKKIKF